MITTEIRTRNKEDHAKYDVSASITLYDDLTYTVHGNEALLGLDDLVLLAPGPRRVRFADDPEYWMTHLNDAYRDGYVLAVVTLCAPTGKTGTPRRVQAQPA